MRTTCRLIDAYEDAAHEIPEAPDNPSFTEETSSFWRVDDRCDWIERDLPQRRWLVRQYLMQGKVTALIGPPEASKSALALKWGIALALNYGFGDFNPIPLPGEQPRPRRVGILNAEDDADEQRRRISSMIRNSAGRLSGLEDNLIRIGPGVGGTAGLFTAAPDTGEVCTTAAFEDLKTFIKKRAIDVLILDPLVELMGGLDENSNAIMGQVFAKLRGLAEDCKIAVLVIHHTKKGVAVPGNLEAARGGGALGGSIRIGLTLTVMSEAEAIELGIQKDKRKHYVRLDNAKQSYGPPSDAALWFHRDSIELDNGDSAPALGLWSPPKAQALNLEQLAPIEAAIKAGTRTNEPYSLKLSVEGRSIRHLLVNQGITGKVGQEQVLTALREQCALVNAEYQRRNEKNQKRETGWGARIGQFPAIEWIDPPQATRTSTPSGNDETDRYNSEPTTQYSTALGK